MEEENLLRILTEELRSKNDIVEENNLLLWEKIIFLQEKLKINNKETLDKNMEQQVSFKKQEWVKHNVKILHLI